MRARIPQQLWRRTHYLSFPLFVTTTVHALTAGTDRHNPLVVGGVMATCADVTTLTALRLARSGRSAVAPQRRVEQPSRPAGAGQRVASVGGTPAGR